MNLEVSCSMQIRDPQLADVEVISGHLLGFLRDHGVCDTRFLFELDLVVTEGLNNAIEHCCPGTPDPMVSLDASLSPDALVVAIGDPSSFPGWEGLASLPDNPLAEGGRGRFLIEQLTDNCSHEIRNGTHVLILKKSFNPQQWSYEPGSQESVLSAMTEEVGASYEMINALIGLGELLAGAGEVDKFLKLALDRVRELTGAGAAYVRMQRSTGLELEGSVGTLLGELRETIPSGMPCIEAKVFETGEEITVTSALSGDDPLAGIIQAAFIAPILYKSGRSGVLVLAQAQAGMPFFTAAQLQVARVVGEYLGIVAAINELQQRRESEQRALRELEIAAEIQMSLMPQEFHFSRHLDVFGICRPALEAGGDYFDFIPLPDGALLIVCADVMGKGVSAALVANMLRTNIRALSHRAGDPGALLTMVNANMATDLRRLEMFITVACAWISPDAADIREASAGHPTGILCHAGASSSVLKSQCLPIGVVGQASYETHHAGLAVGDALILFTDGLTEACDKAGEFYESTGLIKEITREPVCDSHSLVRRVLDAVDRFSGHAPPGDDRTLLAAIRLS